MRSKHPEIVIFEEKILHDYTGCHESYSAYLDHVNTIKN